MTQLYADEVLTADQIQAIGYVAVESANLERIVEKLICAIQKGSLDKSHLSDMGLTGKLNRLRELVNDSLLNDQVTLIKFNTA